MSLTARAGALLISGTLIALGQGTVQERGGARLFVSGEYGFSIAVPDGWGVSAALDTPVFFFAPSPAAFIQDNIPRGGGVIAMQAHDTVSGKAKAATTPEAWATADPFADASSPSLIEPFQFPPESGVARAVLRFYDEPNFGPDQRPRHTVAIFFEFRQKLFAARLSYNLNDPTGPMLQRVFQQTVRSLRPLTLTRGGR